MRLASVLVVGVSAWLCFQAPASAETATDALKLVPQDALGFALLNRIADADAKMTEVGKRLQLPAASGLDMLRGITGGLKGFDEKGSALIAFFAVKGEVGATVWVLPVSDYEKFIGAFNPKKVDGGITKIQVHDKEMLVAKKGTYALLAEPAHAKVLEKALHSKKGAAEAMAPLRSFLAGSDMALVLTPHGVKFFAGKGQEGLAKVKAQMANNPQPQTEFLLDWFDRFGAFLKSVGSGVTHAGVALTVDKSGNLDLSGRVLFSEGSNFARGATEVKPLEGGPLAGLPGGRFVLAFSGPMPEGILKGMMELNTKMLGAIGGEKLNPEKLKQLQQAYEKMVVGVRGMSMEMGVGKGDEPLFASMTGLVKVEDAPAYLSNYLNSLKTINALAEDLKLPYVFQGESKKVSGRPAVEVSTDMTGGKADENQKKVFEKLFGPGGKLVASMVAVDDHTILTRYTPAAQAQEAVQAYKSKKAGLASDPGVLKTARLLPEGSQWVMYISPRGAVDMAGHALALFGQGGVQLPEFPGTPPIGAAVKLSETGLEARMVVPASVLDGIGSFSLKWRQGKGGEQVPPGAN